MRKLKMNKKESSKIYIKSLKDIIETLYGRLTEAEHIINTMINKKSEK